MLPAQAKRFPITAAPCKKAKGRTDMKTEDFEKLGVPHDIAEKCATASAEELTGYIPKHRFDEMILARDTERRQREEIEKKISDLEKGRASADELKAELDKLRNEQKAERQKHDEETAKLKIDMAIERELTSSGARSVKIAKAAMAAMADFVSKAKLKEDGTVEGLSEFVSKMKADKESAFLFNDTAASAQKTIPKGGYQPPAGSGAEVPKQPTWRSAIEAKLNHEQ